jgi:uncharacterized protein
MSFAEQYGPWAVVAGASEGTGREFARQIAAQGVSCILVARRQEPLDALAEEIRAESGTQCLTASVDLAAPDASEKIALAASGCDVGLFVGNAGADPNGSRFLDKDIQAWADLVQRNALTTMQCCHHFAGPMRERKRGGLLLVNSGACYSGGSFTAAYSASKAFLLCLAEGLWAELAPHGVHVLSQVLGVTDTPAFHTLLAQRGMPAPAQMASPREVAKIGLAQLPHGPVYNWGQANEVAGYAPTSADARRARVLAIDQYTRRIFGG